MEFFVQDLINLNLKSCKYIEQYKRYYLISKTILLNFLSVFLYIFLLNHYFEENTDKIKLNKNFCQFEIL